MTVVEITDRLEMNLVEFEFKRWRVQGCCAVSGEGLYEGLDWISKTDVN